MTETAPIAELLQHSGWMRRLARSLVRDDAAADDLLQETWVLALRHPPRAGKTVRAWLGEVLRNVMRAKLRSDARRARREDASVDEEAHVPSADQLVGAVELQRLLAQEVLGLNEPYRSTLLLRFYEGLSPTEIAEREGLPAGTVRWRLKEGLDQLRIGLDKKHAGDRGAWLRALAPLSSDKLARVTLGKGISASAPKGGLIMKIGVGAVIAVGVSAAWLSLKHKTHAQVPTKPAVVLAAPARATATTIGASRGQPPMDKSVRADLLKKIGDARRAAHPESLPSSDPSALDKEYVQQQMKELVPLVKECFENALVDHPNLAGKLVVGFSIVGDPSVGGLVADSQIVDAKSTITDKDVRECIQETMYAARFPPPEEGGEVHIEYPFVLMPSDDTPPSSSTAATPNKPGRPIGPDGKPLSPEQLERLEAMVKSGLGPDGKPISPVLQQRLERVRSGLEPL